MIANQLESQKESRPISSKLDNFVTKDGLKIAFLESRQENESRFHSIDLRFNKIDMKLNLLIWGMGLLFTAYGTCFGFILKILFDIQSKI